MKESDSSIIIGTIAGLVLLGLGATNHKSPPVIDLSDLEKEHIALLVCSEAEEQPYEAKVATARVVINRIMSPQFPDSVDTVIHQSGQFVSVQTGEYTVDKETIHPGLLEESFKAVEEALRKDPTNGAIFYANSLFMTPEDYPETYIELGNFLFYK